MHTTYFWQEQQWDLVLSYAKHQKVPHALLLTGSPGLGKKAFAYAVAEYLLCGKGDKQSCGSCPACRWLAAGSHPDFFIVKPEADSQVIKIEQIRQLIESLNQTSQQSGYQIVVIEPAEAMNRAAANALLKTLEEPLGSVVFLLVNHNLNELPPTIRSRCQKINFASPPVSMSLSWLKKQLPDQPHLESLLALAENVPLQVLTFIEQKYFESHARIFDRFIDMAGGKFSPLEMASLINQMTPEMSLNILFAIAMDFIRLKVKADAHKQEAIERVIHRVSFSKLFRFIDQLLSFKKCLNDKVNLNTLIFYESLFVEWVPE